MAKDAMGFGTQLYDFRITAPAGYVYDVQARGQTASHAREAVHSWVKRNESGAKVTFLRQVGEPHAVKCVHQPSAPAQLKPESLWDIVNFGV